MSWAQVSKINSNFIVPLDIIFAIDHISLVGSSFKPEDNFELTKKILQYDTLSNALYSNEISNIVISNGFWNYILNGGSNQVGKDINEAFCLNIPDLNNLKTLTEAFSVPEYNFKIAQVAGTTMIPSGYLTNLVNYSGCVTGLLSNYDAMLDFIKYTKDNRFYTVKALRASTTGYNEMHNSNNLVVLKTVGSGTYTVPEGVCNITTVAISGGGGGGGGYGSACLAGGAGGDGGGESGTKGSYSENTSGKGAGGNGGNSGAYRIHTGKYNAGTSVSYTVGAGGAGGAAGAAGSAGGASRFNNIQGTKFNGNQNYIIPKMSTAGVGNPDMGMRCGHGAGGYGGGNGSNGALISSDSSYVNTGGTGGKTYGTGGGGGGGGTIADSLHSLNGGAGGGGYGGGGGGGGSYYDSSRTNAAGGAGGQGCIALYLGRKEFPA